jgi:hypothetical protein
MRRLAASRSDGRTLDNLVAVKADAAGIAYAAKRNWLIVSGGLHSVRLTEDGRQRLKAR